MLEEITKELEAMRGLGVVGDGDVICALAWARTHERDVSSWLATMSVTEATDALIEMGRISDDSAPRLS